jgi:hypothetical protein
MLPRKLKGLALVTGIYAFLLALHGPLLRLPYYWDEAGYYIPAALDFYHRALLIPVSTEPTGHTPLLSIYLGSVWHVLGSSPVVTRCAMLLIAAFTVGITYEMGRRIEGVETGIWSSLLLAVSPLFFAQSSLAFLDLPVALFTTWAAWALIESQWVVLAVAASLAVMSKETAVVMLPAASMFVWQRCREQRLWTWAALILPLAPLGLWSVYYKQRTGFWTGNAGYLQYNLYSTLQPVHVLRSFLARCEELFFSGGNFLLTLGAILSFWRLRRKSRSLRAGNSHALQELPAGHGPDSYRSPILSGKALNLAFFAACLATVYIGLLSVVGGAILPRYMLPVFPICFLLAVILISRFPKRLSRLILAVAATGFILCWHWNPPYPFPYEDNLAYADFIRLHQQAARFLDAQPPEVRILTAWPATDELRQPWLGYTTRARRVEAVDGFTPNDFRNPPGFDLLYFYSRKWEPPHNWMLRSARWRDFVEHFYSYTPQASDAELMARFHLILIREFQRRGQWVRIYAVSQRPER